MSQIKGGLYYRLVHPHSKAPAPARIVRWERKARVNYVHCRTGKGNLQSWRNKLDDSVDPMYRTCGRYVETGKHVAPCVEEIGRRWGSWEDMNDRRRWLKKVKDGGEEYTASTGYPQYSLVFGQDCVLLVELMATSWAMVDWNRASIREQLLATQAKQFERRKENLDAAAERLSRNRQANKEFFDRNRRQRVGSLDVGI
ncbi:hypothetical protein BGX38DRAFT_823305 [Terfezia claveryi]|nr:hypothetical protein BGX38DRAFT_823305 [Terfezia claveryi]